MATTQSKFGRRFDEEFERQIAALASRPGAKQEQVDRALDVSPYSAIGQAKAQVTQARAQVDQAGANYEMAGVNYGRASSLYGKDLRAVAKQDVDTTKSTLDVSQAALNAAKANVEAGQSTARRMSSRRTSVGETLAQKHSVNADRRPVGGMNQRF